MRLRLPLGYIRMGLHYVRVALWLLRRLRDYIGARVAFRMQLIRFGLDRRLSVFAGGPPGPRVAACAGWHFPVYSHTFVYQELTQLIRAGFRVRFFYGALNPHDALAPQFEPLWRARRRFFVHPAICVRSLAYFRRRAPHRVEAVLSAMEAASGLSREALLAHEHVRQAFAIARLLRAFRPDYLHSYFFYQDTMYMLVTSMLLDIPRGVSCYADHMLQDYELKMVGAQLRQCSLAVATSSRIRAELLSIAPGVPDARVIVKPNAINAAHFPLRSRAGRVEGRPLAIVTLCRIEPKKGLSWLAEALHRLERRGVAVRWTAIGGVDASDSSRRCDAELRQRVEALGLSGVVTFAGKRGEAAINAAFADADLFVAPFIETEAGDKDGVPTALLEAMASGLPVVATDAGSIPEVIAHDRNGVLVPQRDAEALAVAIAELGADEARRERLGAAGSATVRERFSVDVCEQVLHDRIRSLVSASDRRRRGVPEVAR